MRTKDQLRGARGIFDALLFAIILWLCIILTWQVAHAQVQVPDGPTVTGSITAAQSVTINANGKCGFGYALTGTWTGTVVAEVQDPSGAWNSVSVVPFGSTSVSSFTANSSGRGTIGGGTGVRFRGNTVATGTASVALMLTPSCEGVVIQNANSQVFNKPIATNSATGGLTASAASAATNVVLCTAACNLYDAYVSVGSTTGYIMVINATSLPSNGAITAGTASGNLQDCIEASIANTTYSLFSGGAPPERFSTGAVVALSSTGCASLTAATADFLHGRASQ